MAEQTGAAEKLDILPGFYTEDTEAGTVGRWVDGDLVRFKNGLLQSIGGWVQQTLSASILGIPRSLHDWQALDSSNLISLGTEKRLYVIEEDLTVHNITPIRDSGTLGAAPISTSDAGLYDPNLTGDASFVSIADTSHGCSVGDIVTIGGADPVGGITIDGDYEVKAVTDVNNYILQHSEEATSTAVGGGVSVTYIYEITAGSASSGIAGGWGTGSWGQATWNTPRLTSSFVLELRTWSLDNWGEDLIASPRGGTIYVWDKSGGFSARATEIANAPDTVLRVIVSEQNRQLIAFGAHTGSASDPLFIAWSDTEDYDTWIPAVDNTAGDKRIDNGSEIITAVQTRNGILIFTDIGGHFMQPVGGNEVYGFKGVGGNMSIAGPAAAVDVAGIVYIMTKNNFYVFDGVMRVLPCDVWTTVFDSDKTSNAINKAQASSVVCSHVQNFNEVWWFYPSQGETTNNRYVIYNYVENIWYTGSLGRSSFHDFSDFLDTPYGFDESGNIFTHEDGDLADVESLDWYAESGDLSISDGDYVMHISKLIPDFDRIQGSVNVTLKTKKRPQDTQKSKGPYEFDGSIGERGVRARGRYISMLVEAAVSGTKARMGSWRARIRPDGER